MRPRLRPEKRPERNWRTMIQMIISQKGNISEYTSTYISNKIWVRSLPIGPKLMHYLPIGLKLMHSFPIGLKLMISLPIGLKIMCSLSIGL